MSVLWFVIILLVLVISHEFGHFVVAKRVGVRVDEFGFGFPPKLFSFKRGETTYSFNALPFGGFVKIFGEDPEESDLAGDQERSFFFKPAYKKAAVIVAGVIFNWVLAWVVLSLAFAVGIAGPTIVEEVSVLSPAAIAGIEVGDSVISVEDASGARLDSPSTDALIAFIDAHSSEVITIGVTRGTELHSFSVIPEVVAGGVRIGTKLSSSLVRYGAFESIREAGVATVKLTKSTAEGLWMLFQNVFFGDRALLGSVAGPVGIVGLVGDAANFGVGNLLFLTALISINLAVLNLIPFPALDGGRLLFLLIEKIKGSPIKRRVANTANAVGLLALLLIMFVVTYNDIIRIFFR